MTPYRKLVVLVFLALAGAEGCGPACDRCTGTGCVPAKADDGAELIERRRRRPKPAPKAEARIPVVILETSPGPRPGTYYLRSRPGFLDEVEGLVPADGYAHRMACVTTTEAAK